MPNIEEVKKILYNKETDSLLILWAENKPAVSRDIGGDFWLREIPETGEIIGIEIENLKSFAQKYQLFPQPLDASKYTGLYDDWFFGDCGGEMTWKEFERRSMEAEHPQPLTDEALVDFIEARLEMTYAYGLSNSSWNRKSVAQQIHDKALTLLQQRVEEAVIKERERIAGEIRRIQAEHVKIMCSEVFDSLYSLRQALSNKKEGE